MIYQCKTDTPELILLYNRARITIPKAFSQAILNVVKLLTPVLVRISMSILSCRGREKGTQTQAGKSRHIHAASKWLEKTQNSLSLYHITPTHHTPLHNQSGKGKDITANQPREGTKTLQICSASDVLLILTSCCSRQILLPHLCLSLVLKFWLKLRKMNDFWRKAKGFQFFLLCSTYLANKTSVH